MCSGEKKKTWFITMFLLSWYFVLAGTSRNARQNLLFPVSSARNELDDTDVQTRGWSGDKKGLDRVRIIYLDASLLI
jgi:hypothetical protein